MDLITRGRFGNRWSAICDLANLETPESGFSLFWSDKILDFLPVFKSKLPGSFNFHSFEAKSAKHIEFHLNNTLAFSTGPQIEKLSLFARGVSLSRETHTDRDPPPPTVKIGRYASYWNDFLFEIHFINIPKKNQPCFHFFVASIIFHQSTPDVTSHSQLISAPRPLSFPKQLERLLCWHVVKLRFSKQKITWNPLKLVAY